MTSNKLLTLNVSASPTLAGLLDVACKPCGQKNTARVEQDSAGSVPGATKATPAAPQIDFVTSPLRLRQICRVPSFPNWVSKQESTATDRRLRLQIKSGFQRQINEHLVLDHLVSGCKVFLASCTNLPNDSQLLVS